MKSHFPNHNVQKPPASLATGHIGYWTLKDVMGEGHFQVLSLTLKKSGLKKTQDHFLRFPTDIDIWLSTSRPALLWALQISMQMCLLYTAYIQNIQCAYTANISSTIPYKIWETSTLSGSIYTGPFQQRYHINDMFTHFAQLFLGSDMGNRRHFIIFALSDQNLFSTHMYNVIQQRWPLWIFGRTLSSQQLPDSFKLEMSGIELRSSECNTWARPWAMTSSSVQHPPVLDKLILAANQAKTRENIVKPQGGEWGKMLTCHTI